MNNCVTDLIFSLLESQSLRKMWSTWLIIAVAVASGVTFTCFAVILTSIYERARHRRILLRDHTAQMPKTQVKRKYPKQKIAQQLDNVLSVCLPDPGTSRWTQLSSRDDVSEGCASHQDKFLFDNSALNHESCDQPRYTSWVPPEFHERQEHWSTIPAVDSPLSAITEFSVSPQVSPTRVDKSTNLSSTCSVTRSKVRSQANWPLAVPKTRFEGRAQSVSPTKGLVARVRSTGNNANHGRAATARRSASLDDSLTRPPQDPLPPLPAVGVPKRHPNRSLHTRFSNSTIDSVGSSVLDSVIGRQGDLQGQAAVKTKSKAWNEFDFDLQSATLRVDSAAHRQRHQLLQHRAAVPSLRASVDIGLGLAVGATKASRLVSPDIDDSVATNTETFNFNSVKEQFGAHSEPSIARRNSSLVIGSCDIDDSNVNRRVKRPASVNSLHQIRSSFNPLADGKRNSAASGESLRRGHKRQNCVRISGIPVIEPRQSINFFMPAVHKEPVKPATSKAPEKSAMHGCGKLMWPEPLSVKRARTNSRIPRPQSDVFSEDSSNLSCIGLDSCKRESNSSQAFRLTKSYAISESPILPPPAYTAAGLRPRLSQPKGPRSPQRAHSPLANRQGAKAKNDQVVGLLESVMQLRSMNSETRLHDTDPNHMLGDYNTQKQISSAQQKSSLVRSQVDPGIEITDALPCSSNQTQCPATPQKHSDKKSISSLSIWENVSVPSDTPKPHTPNLVRLNSLATSTNSTNRGPSLASGKERRTDQERRKNLPAGTDISAVVHNEDLDAESSTDRSDKAKNRTGIEIENWNENGNEYGSEQENGKWESHHDAIIGLGLRECDAGRNHDPKRSPKSNLSHDYDHNRNPWQTPGSLYDREGFWKG